MTLCALTLAACGGGNRGTVQFFPATPPVAMQKEHIRDIHGDRVNDPYYWMYDYFGKGSDSTEVVAYLEAENAYLESVMAGSADFRKRLYAEMRGRIKESDQSVPTFRNGYFYYTRTDEGREYYKYCRKKGSLDAPEEIMFDVDAMAEGHEYFSLGGVAVSPDNRLAAFAVDTVSRRQYTIRVKDLETGEIVGESIAGVTNSIVWAADSKTFFYILNNPLTLLGERVMRHELGTPAESDALVYLEKDDTNYLGIRKSKNQKYIFITSEATLSSEQLYISADEPRAAFRPFQPRMKDVLYSVVPLDDRFLVVTNRDAINFKVMSCPLDKTGVENWIDYIPHREDVLVEYIDEFKDYIVVNERQEGLLKMRVRRLSDGSEHYLDFGESTYSAWTSSNPEYDNRVVRYGYTSLTTPNSTYDYDMESRERTLLKQQEVLGGFSPDDYQSERLYATSRDGVRVPVSLVYRKGTKFDGSTPLYLYGYGSYGASMDPYFSSTRLSLLDRGFIYAIAHIRGGQEMGRQWYEDGKMHKKINTFNDFIDCAEYLVARGYTSPEHLYASGGSAGGLLIGAVVNMRPELWNGVVADVPFVDVVNTMLDEDIPLTTGEYDEWGNPNVEEDYLYMKSYSPYENVEAKEYPAMLVTTGLHDSQVQYFEPAKWVAKLRATATGDNVLLLKTDMDAGHGGASGRFDYLNDIAMEYAFLFTLEGIDQ